MFIERHQSSDSAREYITLLLFIVVICVELSNLRLESDYGPPVYLYVHLIKISARASRGNPES